MQGKQARENSAITQRRESIPVAAQKSIIESACWIARQVGKISGPLCSKAKGRFSLCCGTENALIKCEWRSPSETGLGGWRMTAEFVRHAVRRTHIKRSIAALRATDRFARCALKRLLRLKFAVLIVSQQIYESKLSEHKW